MILTTDFTCMEMYLLDAGAVQQLFETIGLPEKSLRDVFRDIGQVARELFLVRAVIQSLAINVGMFSFRKYCSREGHAVTFDSARYIDAVLVNAGAATHKASFHLEYQRLERSVGADLRNAANGHDLEELLLIAYREKFGIRGLKEPRSVFALLEMAVTAEKLLEYPMFAGLAVRMC